MPWTSPSGSQGVPEHFLHPFSSETEKIDEDQETDGIVISKRMWVLEPERHDAKSYFGHLLAVCPWASPSVLWWIREGRK